AAFGSEGINTSAAPQPSFPETADLSHDGRGPLLPPRHSSRMRKHHDRTVRRISQFLARELKPRVYIDRSPLKIEINETQAADQNEAKKGPWKEVTSGYEYGPAYTTVWFRLTGKVPEHFSGRPLAISAELGSERTVWHDNTPICGLDVEHC